MMAVAGNIGCVVVNFNTAAHTARCLASLEGQALKRLVIVDNGSQPDDVVQVEAAMSALQIPVCLVRLAVNLGFSGGANAGISVLLNDPGIDGVFLLNNDALAEPEAVERLAALLDPGVKATLAGGRMMSLPDRGAVDSLGISFYKSCLASNRKRLEDPYFGPTGGCALYARELLEDLHRMHGYCFDEDFFCYAEDTDLAARALLLGHVPVYSDSTVAHHEGQASTGGGFNDFVLYHGIRNSIWMLVKCVPGSVLLRSAGWVLLLHVGIFIRHIARGRWRVVFRLYRDALAGLPRMWSKRRVIQGSRRVETDRFSQYITPRFYEAGYLRQAVRDLFTRGLR